jgi:single-strand DNA-binding protein
MLNRAELIGRLGRDPDVRYTADGKAIANLALATSEFFRDRDSGQRKEQTEWHRVVLFGKQAEIAGKYLKKGALAYVDGRLRTRKWKNRQGQEQYTTELVGNALTLLDKKGNASDVETESGKADSIGNRDEGFYDFPDMPF